MSSSTPKRPLTEPNNASGPITATKKRQTGIASSARTGQACDRCKVRKIRCDDTDGGCVPCRQNNVECKTSDRITGRAVVRGHTEHLEKENDHLKQRVAELEMLLQRQGLHTGVESKTDPALLAAHYNTPLPTRPQKSQVARDRGATSPDSSPAASISAATSLSQPTGFSLDVFGMKIDFSSFSANVDPVCQLATSFETFHDALFNIHQDKYNFGEPILPDNYDTCIELVKQYIYGVSPWIPVVHPPDLFAIVDKVYDGTGQQLPLAETCMLHMALAGILYHNGLRNKHDDVLRKSFSHYHYVLKRLSLLLRSRTLKDFQAMTMFCGFVRAFPRPTVCWYAIHSTMLAAIEMGMHRTVNALPELKAALSPTEVQIRKCIFWTLLLAYVALAGKFGRPMLFQRTDFDIELPEPTETTESADGRADFVHNSHSFSFGAMAYFFKLGELFLDTYNIIYAVRPDGKYDEHLEELSARHSKWKRQLPASMSRGTIESKEPKNQPFATYIANWSAELDLTLHHPAVCRTKNPRTVIQNLSICISATSVIIQTTAELLSTKSIDSTWTQVLIYTAAIFTSMFAYWERRDHISLHDLSKLGQDLDVGLKILESVGEVLGTKDELRHAVQRITDRCFLNLENHVLRKNGQPTKPVPSTHTAVTPSGYNGGPEPITSTASYLARSSTQAPPVIPTSHNNLLGAFSPPPSSTPDAYGATFNPPATNGFNFTANVQPNPMSGLALSLAYPPQTPTQYSNNASLQNHWTHFAEMNSHAYMPTSQDYDGSSSHSGSVTSGMDNLEVGLGFNGGFGAGMGMPNLLPQSGHLDVPVVSESWPMTVGYETSHTGISPHHGHGRRNT